MAAVLIRRSRRRFDDFGTGFYYDVTEELSEEEVEEMNDYRLSQEEMDAELEDEKPI